MIIIKKLALCQHQYLLLPAGQCYIILLNIIIIYRVLIEDGSCEAHLYAESDMVRELLCISSDQWTHLKEMTSKVGQLSYVRYPFQEEKVGPIFNTVC